jgi:hypothetical protein
MATWANRVFTALPVPLNALMLNEGAPGAAGGPVTEGPCSQLATETIDRTSRARLTCREPNIDPLLTWVRVRCVYVLVGRKSSSRTEEGVAVTPLTEGEQLKLAAWG